MNTKQQLLSMLVSQLVQVLRDIDVSIESTRQEALQAPSRMESRYDSAKQEASYRANELIERRLHIQDDAKNLEKYMAEGIKQCNAVEEGALIGVHDDAGKKSMYFLLPAGQGEILSYPETEEKVFVISTQSPIASAFMHKQVGDVCAYRDKKYEIVSIQ